MKDGLRMNITSITEAFEAVVGNAIGGVVEKDVDVIEPTGEKRSEELITVTTSRIVDGVAICRNIEFIGEERFISEEYVDANKAAKED